MTEIAAFFAGFGAGWVVRATTDSSRSLVVAALAKLYDAADKAQTLVALEREMLEDLLAEARALHEQSKRQASGQASDEANGRGENGAGVRTHGVGGQG